jgi:hypothetical protein
MVTALLVVGAVAAGRFKANQTSRRGLNAAMSRTIARAGTGATGQPENTILKGKNP